MEIMSEDGEMDSCMDHCFDHNCRCKCHDEHYQDIGKRFEHGVWKYDNDDPPFMRKGVFPFLKLPAEIRDRIYGFAFLQDGNRRSAGFKENHRGTIHTALLGTCRQIYKEASKLPLSLNRLNFGSPLHALYFLGFYLMPTQKELVTSLHIEFHWQEFHSSAWVHLFNQLPKMRLTHLGLTIKGGCTEGTFSSHSCFIDRLKSTMKGVKTFNLVLGSANITKKSKKEIQEKLREALIKGYKRTKTPKGAMKRKTQGDGDDKEPAKKAKIAVPTVSRTLLTTNYGSLRYLQIKYQTRLVVSPTTKHLVMRSQKPEREAAKATRELEKRSLLDQYEQLRQYAKSLDHDAAPVKIRLEHARIVAEAFDVPKFKQLAQGIRTTLEERYDRIAAARNLLPPLVKTDSTAAPIEILSSQASDEESDDESSDGTGTSSQASM